MRFEILPVKKEEKLCLVEHQGEQIKWSISRIVKPSTFVSFVGEDDVQVPSDLFKYTNQWLASLTQDQQNALFELYRKAKDTMLYTNTHEEIVIELRESVAAILDFQEFREVHRFLRLSTDIQDPLSVMDVFVEDAAGKNKKNKTYVKSQYQELVTLTFMLRLILPIWGDYLAKISDYTDISDQELSAFDLTSRAKLKGCSAMQRLEEFVENTIPPDANRSPALIDGISTDDYSRWMLALVILRKLIVGNLQDSGEPQGPTLVSYVYNFVRSRSKNDPSYGGYIKDKQHSNTSTGDDVNALSHWEEYREKEPFSAGDIGLVRVGLLDPVELYWQLCIGLDEAESAKFEPSTEVNPEFRELMSEGIGIAQITMLQYVLSPLMSHRLLYDLDDRVPIYNGLLAASSYLKRLGLLEQAIIMTAVKRSSKSMTASPDSTKHRFVEGVNERLAAIYPYDRKTQSLQATVGSKTSYDIAFNAIEDHLRRSQWRITLPQNDIVTFSGGLRASRAYTCPNDIKIVLAEFFIAMNDSAKRIRENRKLKMENLINVSL